jgi:hypothetical protein
MSRTPTCSGSAIMLMAAILPSVMAKQNAILVRPPGAQTSPTAPSMRPGCAPQVRPAVARATASAPWVSVGTEAHGELVGSEDHVGVEQPEQRVELALAGRGKEGVNDLALARQTGPGCGDALQPASGATRELTDRVRGAIHDRRDLGKRHGEEVMQDEHHPLGRAERVEHDKQRRADRLGE